MKRAGGGASAQDPGKVKQHDLRPFRRDNTDGEPPGGAADKSLAKNHTRFYSGYDGPVSPIVIADNVQNARYKYTDGLGRIVFTKHIGGFFKPLSLRIKAVKESANMIRFYTLKQRTHG